MGPLPFPAYTSVRGRGQVGVASINMTAEKVWYSILFSLYACKYGEEKKRWTFLISPSLSDETEYERRLGCKILRFEQNQFLFFALFLFSFVLILILY
jgi:hypothetical protein